ncbi:putative Dol-P-Glc:Glc(2)Man(9)GlcNAc(2)-PP-Dol alpha-1,2-glucosyltransferase [Lineus longissimus]|uniref:putative Dol-P-Glc:Glc(2)Man(9)GlcNAc(2)-PP-Dol alpha-1,2-glucosyltransferase n=1 Tax=Lineus longissimus TaxID=88925 RepID=UPI00315DF62C
MVAFSQTTLATVEIAGLLFGLSGCLLLKIQNTQQEPYMDEYFHVRQTQKYCHGFFQEWDPMITTLPGLYVISAGIMKAATIISHHPMEEVCITFWLRCISVGFTVANFFLLLFLMWSIHHKKEDYDPPRSLLTASALAVFPLLYFYTFLFYTEGGSTFFVLLMYALSLHRRHNFAALIGMVAICFRQTNLIWVIFVAGEEVVRIIIDHIKPEKKELTEKEFHGWKFVRVVLQTLIQDLPYFRHLPVLIGRVLSNCLPYILTGVCFGVFIIWNDGIVVGDRTSHEACFHAPQLFYFFAFTLGMSFMHLITPEKIWNFLKYLWRHPIMTILICAIMTGCIWKFTYAHRYLLADNRHYTFYVWAKVFRRHKLVKYALIPGYFFASWGIFDALKRKDSLWKLLFFICVIMATVPQKLLEFRYFILPYLFFRLNMHISSHFQIILEICLYGVINGLTIYYFIEKPFKWGNSPEWQRFMW